jgi:hypothetical protein
MKRITRRQVEQWLFPIRAALAEIKSGEVDSLYGYAVTKLRKDDEYMRIDYCIVGWLGVLSRIVPSFDLTSMRVIGDKLASDTPLTVTEINTALRSLREAEELIVGGSLKTIKSMLLTEQIQIEIDALA